MPIATTNGAVGGASGRAARVADRGVRDTLELIEILLRTPKSSERKHGDRVLLSIVTHGDRVLLSVVLLLRLDEALSEGALMAAGLGSHLLVRSCSQQQTHSCPTPEGR